MRNHYEDSQAVRDLHVCCDCGSQLVQPLSWLELADGSWQLELRCPNCGSQRTGSFSEAEVSRLEDRLDDGIAAMLGDLQRLTHANLAHEVERFIASLHAGLIDPGDF